MFNKYITCIIYFNICCTFFYHINQYYSKYWRQIFFVLRVRIFATKNYGNLDEGGGLRKFVELWGKKDITNHQERMSSDSMRISEKTQDFWFENWFKQLIRTGRKQFSNKVLVFSPLLFVLIFTEFGRHAFFGDVYLSCPINN